MVFIFPDLASLTQYFYILCSFLFVCLLLVPFILLQNSFHHSSLQLSGKTWFMYAKTSIVPFHNHCEYKIIEQSCVNIFIQGRESFGYMPRTIASLIGRSISVFWKFSTMVSIVSLSVYKWYNRNSFSIFLPALVVIGFLDKGYSEL